MLLRRHAAQPEVGAALMHADDLSVAVVPEPGSYALLAMGLATLALVGRRAMHD